MKGVNGKDKAVYTRWKDRDRDTESVWKLNPSAMDGFASPAPSRHSREVTIQLPPQVLGEGHYLDGSLVLGRDMPRGNRYTTRFYVKDRKLQRQECFREAARDTLAPWLEGTWTSIIVGVLESDIFFIGVYALVLLLQVLKTSYCRPEEHKSIRISLSVFETVITCGLIIVRLVNTRDKYSELRHFRNDIEHVHDDEHDIEKHPEGTTLKLWINACLISGIAVILFNLLCLIIFHVTSNLRWTIFTNNLGMFYMLVITYILLNHINGLKSRIVVDHHKIALYESLLLLGEFYWAQNVEHAARVRNEMELYCETIKATRQFARPVYITCPEDCKWDVITGMESGV